MFGHRFFGARFFGPHYFGPADASAGGGGGETLTAGFIVCFGRMMGR